MVIGYGYKIPRIFWNILTTCVCIMKQSIPNFSLIGWKLNPIRKISMVVKSYCVILISIDRSLELQNIIWYHIMFISNRLRHAEVPMCQLYLILDVYDGRLGKFDANKQCTELIGLADRWCSTWRENCKRTVPILPIIFKLPWTILNCLEMKQIVLNRP